MPRRVGTKNEMCSIHDDLLDVPRKSRKRIVQLTEGEDEGKSAEMRAARAPDGETYIYIHPLDRPSQERSRPLIKRNTTSEGLSKLLREMN